MSRSDELNALADQMAASYDMRQVSLNKLINDTHQTLGRFHQEHRQTTNEMRQNLANFEKQRKEDFASLKKELKGDVATLRKECHEMLSNFANENQQACDSLMHLARTTAAKQTTLRNTHKQAATMRA